MTWRAGVFVLVDQALGLRSIDGRDRPVLVLYAKQQGRSGQRLRPTFFSIAKQQGRSRQ